ncbi:MAG: DUF1587 domain-containing protein [Opitutales bacterium]|nr:DUF1587 domain-containing protein [Opitutales bacterium]
MKSKVGLFFHEQPRWRLRHWSTYCRAFTLEVPYKQIRILKRGASQAKALQNFGFIASIFWVQLVHGSDIDPIPSPYYDFLETYCLDCHDDFERKAEISLEEREIDWSDHESVELWERVINVLNKGEMPPKKERQPSASERTAMTEWLDDRLLEHSPIGGTSLRRLNKREYRSSLNELFEIDYILPDSFPDDNRAHGFDNQGKALTLSGPLLDS